jgi:hypothetical protein
MAVQSTVPAELLYRTENLVEAFELIPVAPQFLRDKMFPKVATSASDYVSVETYLGSQKLAPYCSRFSKGTAVPREKEQTSIFSPPFIKPVRNLTADEAFFKSPTQSANARTNRDAELLVRDFTELDQLISRREEWMAAQCVFTGSIRCLDGDSGKITAELAYGTISKTTPAKAWSDTTTDPLADLRGALRLVSSACGASADLVVMGRSAADAFEAHPNVQSAYDKLRIAPGTLTPENVSWGVQSLGTYRGIQLFVYEAEYQDSAGAMQPFVPVDNVLVAATALAGSMAYAGVAQVNQEESKLDVFEGRRIPVVSYESLEDIRKFRLSSRPVPVPTNLAAWHLLDVL